MRPTRANVPTIWASLAGAQAALPIWMAYMGPALKGVPEQALTQPGGVVAMRVNPETGLRTADGQGIVDYFYQEFLPPEQETLVGGVVGGERPREEVRNQLF